jgi:hypothetical protein
MSEKGRNFILHSTKQPWIVQHCVVVTQQMKLMWEEKFAKTIKSLNKLSCFDEMGWLQNLETFNREWFWCLRFKEKDNNGKILFFFFTKEKCFFLTLNFLLKEDNGNENWVWKERLENWEE